MSIIDFLHKVDKYILNPIIALLFGIALLYFLYGIVRFLSIDASEKGNTRQEARDAIMWGIIGMVIMFSVYAIIGIVLQSFGITSDDVGPASEFIGQ